MVVVLKFGGSVLRSAADYGVVARHVAGMNSAVIVVSAMKGVTDALIAATQDECKEAFSLRERHLAEGERDRSLEAHVRAAERLMAHYRARPSPYLRERILSCGERVSAAHLVAAIRAASGRAVLLDAGAAGIRATDEPPNGRPDIAASLDRIRRRKDRIVRPARIAVVPGFYGRDPAGRVLTLGRGASDVTAALLARGLGASELHFVKDVGGVFERDPRATPGARLLDRVDAQRAHELAKEGPWVLHASTFDVLAGGGMELLVRGTSGSTRTRIAP